MDSVEWVNKCFEILENFWGERVLLASQEIGNWDLMEQLLFTEEEIPLNRDKYTDLVKTIRSSELQTIYEDRLANLDALIEKNRGIVEKILIEN